MWALSISGWYMRKLSCVFEFRIEPVHPDKCGGLAGLGNFCFGLASPLFVNSVFFTAYSVTILIISTDPSSLATVSLLAFSGLLFGLPLAVFTFCLPLWSIHTKMLRKRETAEETYAIRLAALQEQIQLLLDNNQLEEAKALKEKKELLETVYIPSPTWPFNVRSKLFSAVTGAGGSFLLGFLTALPPLILQAFFHVKP